MANIIPNDIFIDSNESERLVFYKLSELSNEYNIWSELDVDNRYPDFVVLGPKIGIIIIEVKGWTIDQIVEVNKKDAKLLINGKRETRSSPYKQVQAYKTKVFNILSNKLNRNNKISISRKLKNNSIIIYPNISRLDLMNLESKYTSDIKEVFNEKITIFTEDLAESTDANYIENLLISKLIHKPEANEYLTQSEIITIRDFLDPVITLDQNMITDIVKTLDYQQENLVKCYPDKHILVRGIAGSGKSILVIKRAEFLAKKYSELENFSILLLCKNISYYAALSVELKKLTNSCMNLSIKHYSEIINDDNKYDYLLIDEGQDFSKVELEKAISKLKSDAKLFLVADGAQNIYDKDYDFSNLGINFGKIIKLNENYRNTREIINFANRYLIDDRINISKQDKVTDSRYIIEPAMHYRPGEIPEVIKCSSLDAEIDYVYGRVKELILNGHMNKEICIILFNVKDHGERVRKAFKGIETYFLTANHESKSNFDPNKNVTPITTAHSIKGLEFSNVFIIGFLDYQNITEKEKKTVYVALTRATEKLVITHSINNTHTDILNSVRKEMVEESLIKSNNDEYHLKLNLFFKETHLVISNKNLKIDMLNEQVRNYDEILSTKRELEHGYNLLKLEGDKLSELLAIKEIELEKETEEKNRILMKNTKLKSEVAKKESSNNNISENVDESKKSKIGLLLPVILTVCIIGMFVNHLIAGNNEKKALLDNLVNENDAQVILEDKANNMLSIKIDGDYESTYIEKVSSNISDQFKEGHYWKNSIIDIKRIDKSNEYIISINAIYSENKDSEKEIIIIEFEANSETDKISLRLCNDGVKFSSDLLEILDVYPEEIIEKDGDGFILNIE